MGVLYRWPPPEITIPIPNHPTTYRFECSIVRFGISSPSACHQLVISSSSVRHQRKREEGKKRKREKRKRKKEKREKGKKKKRKKGKRESRKREKGKKR